VRPSWARRPVSRLLVVAAACAAWAQRPPARSPGSGWAIEGELRTWHRATLTFDGPQAGEQEPSNPFRNYRLSVTFEHEGRTVDAPGYFAADGNAAESGATSGSRWRVHFMPDAPGRWSYRASFRRGTDVALSENDAAGAAVPQDGITGSFVVEPSDKQPPDFRALGNLRHQGGHYLRLASGRPFLKGGADSPENFLAYEGFDDTDTSDAPIRQGEAARTFHRYVPHLLDWRPGDPSWRGGRGRGIIGALNYLASRGMNSVYFLTMNVGGDGDDVFPWIARDVRDRFDCSKLDQWEMVFSHMTRLGLMLHAVTQETENQTLLDGGELGPLRRLYYRELVARFAHHPAITWNLGEENGEGHEGAPFNTDAQRKAFARYFKQIDPYDHPVVVHTWPGRQEQIYTPLLDEPALDGASLQLADMRQTYDQTRRWVERSAAAGRPWLVSLDEIGPADAGVKPDAEDPTHDDVRVHALWGNLMAGGAGVEWYFGYKYPHNDLNAESWRSRDAMWRQTRRALDFFEQYVPFDRARPLSGIVAAPDARCFGIPGELYVVHVIKGGEVTIDLTPWAGAFEVSWYGPRTGGPLLQGSVTGIEGGRVASLGRPPRDPEADWVALVRR
jgi:Domain of unknown function (DUF5060)